MSKIYLRRLLNKVLAVFMIPILMLGTLGMTFPEPTDAPPGETQEIPEITTPKPEEISPDTTPTVDPEEQPAPEDGIIRPVMLSGGISLLSATVTTEVGLRQAISNNETDITINGSFGINSALTIPSGLTVTISAGNTITNNGGMIYNNGTIYNNSRTCKCG